MNWKDIKVEYSELIEKNISSYSFKINTSIHYFVGKMDVYEQIDIGFYARPNVGIRDNIGYAQYADEWGEDEKEAIQNSLEEIQELLRKYYPNGIPEHAIAYRLAEEYLEEKKNVNFSLPEIPGAGEKINYAEGKKVAVISNFN